MSPSFPHNPQSTKAVVLHKSDRKPVYHDISVDERTVPALKNGEVLVKMNAVSFNRRELWIRMGMYPGITFETVIGADGAGTVIASFDPTDTLLNTRVFLSPGRGWAFHPSAPEARQYGILGGTRNPLLGTFAEYVVVERNQVIPAPEHLDDVHLSAWPLGGLTAWRAVVVNGEVARNQNVLITGIGGGVALLALQICIAKGANVYVTSGSQDKIDKAVALGARGGVNYKDKDWPKRVASLLLSQTTTTDIRQTLDLVVDSGGGDILQRVSALLKAGGRFVCYGMTSQPSVTLTMREVMRNQKILGSTMGSHADLLEATTFLSAHKIIPIVSHVLHGLESADEGFELMKRGDQFGKIVIQVHGGASKL